MRTCRRRCKVVIDDLQRRLCRTAGARRRPGYAQRVVVDGHRRHQPLVRRDQRSSRRSRLSPSSTALSTISHKMVVATAVDAAYGTCRAACVRLRAFWGRRCLVLVWLCCSWPSRNLLTGSAPYDRSPDSVPEPAARRRRHRAPLLSRRPPEDAPAPTRLVMAPATTG